MFSLVGSLGKTMSIAGLFVQIVHEQGFRSLVVSLLYSASIVTPEQLVTGGCRQFEHYRSNTESYIGC